MDNRPIGVFDSGVGGISVLKELVALMPNENFIYFGDSVNAPYGVKELDEVRTLTTATADYLIGKGCKAIVIACNTATAAAVTFLRDRYENVPVIGVEPALKPAVLANPDGRILVLATAITLHEDKFHRLMERYKDEATILTLPCPGIVELVEKGILEGPEVDAYLCNILADYIVKPPDGIVLGCTHYPFVKESIIKVFNGNMTTYDGGLGTARETLHQLEFHNIRSNYEGQGTVTIENSNPEAINIAKFLFNGEKNNL